MTSVEIDNITIQFEELLNNIEVFYIESLKMAPETCLEEAERVINALEAIVKYLSCSEVDAIKKTLEKAYNAWENKDFVLARDYFYFEMKPYIERILLFKQKK